MDIVLFTLSYPYGNQETFIDEELKYLCKHFNTVYILPRLRHNTIRSTPRNVVVSDCRTSKNLDKPGIHEIFSHICTLIYVYFFSFLNSKKPHKYLIYFKSLVHYAINDLRNYYDIRKYIKENQLSGAIFYDYWFVNATISLCLLKKQKKISKLICRAHGFDLYDERQYEGIASFRPFKIKYIDKVYAISLHGSNYLKSRINRSYHDKIETSYLGINLFNKSNNKRKKHNKYLVVSCSNITPVKRVDSIAQALINSNLPIHWIHFGDGNKLLDLESYLMEVESVKFSYELLGSVSNKEILNFYANNEIDLFINLSKSEGLPVSIMEAISFGIPVVATSINGVPEILNNKNGVLVNPSLNPEEMQQAIRMILLKKPFKRDEIIETFIHKFDAGKNYNSFILSLKNTFEIK